MMLDRDLFEFFEHTADAAFTVGDSGEICSWNASAEGLFGFARTDAIGKTCSLTRVMSSRQFSIRPVPPFRLDFTVWVLRRRQRNLVDRWDGATYRRVVAVNGRALELAVRQTGAPAAPRLDVTVTPAPRSETETWQLRRLLDPAVARTVAAWQPYAGLVYFHLLLDGLLLAGAFEPDTPQSRDRSASLLVR
jgi:PAS domain-containing protein